MGSGNFSGSDAFFLAAPFMGARSDLDRLVNWQLRAGANQVAPGVFESFPERTSIQLASREKQAAFLSEHIPGLSRAQAETILDQAHSRGSSVVFGGSRIRGDYGANSDLDVGFGSLTQRQAQRVVRNINRLGEGLQIEADIPIVPGKSTPTVSRILSPEEFFQRSGVRAGGDLKAGQPYYPSGSITVTTDGRILIIPPGQ